MPKVIQVIQSDICRGTGTEENPVRTVTQYHTVDGEFLAENDWYFERQRQAEFVREMEEREYGGTD